MAEERFRIGTYKLLEDTVFRDAGYACAAWYEDYLVKAGEYPITAYFSGYRKNEIDYFSPNVELEGVIVGDNFSSYFCGNMVAENFDKHVGEKTRHSLHYYDFDLIEAILHEKGWPFKENVEFSLLPEFEIREKYYEWEGKIESLKKIYKKED